MRRWRGWTDAFPFLKTTFSPSLTEPPASAARNSSSSRTCDLSASNRGRVGLAELAAEVDATGGAVAWVASARVSDGVARR